MFIDYTEIHLIAGQGGTGCQAFHREKYVAKGGPSGGDGGKGGSIIFKADENLTTLLDFKYNKIYKAKRGEHGKGSNQHGKNASNIVLKVPIGSVVRNKETNEVIVDFIKHGQREIIAKGGKGGRGNARFATPTNRAPRKFEYGREGDNLEISIELKLLADVGLVGFPNAGKSSLLSALSDAKPKIADYPFTTLKPQLGIIKYFDYQSIVMADIPGIIEGASDGKGLGLTFLRHIERTKTIAYVIDGESESINDVYLKLRNELKSYSNILLEKPSLIIVTKIDLIDIKDINVKGIQNQDIVYISSVTHENLKELKTHLFKNIEVSKEMFDVESVESDEFDF